MTFSVNQTSSSSIRDHLLKQKVRVNFFSSVMPKRAHIIPGYREGSPRSGVLFPPQEGVPQRP